MKTLSITILALLTTVNVWSFTPEEIERDAETRIDNYGSGYSDMGTARREPDGSGGNGGGRRGADNSQTNMPKLGDRDGNSKKDTIRTKASGVKKEKIKIPIKKIQQKINGVYNKKY